MTGAIVPRPIAWVSSIGPDGTPNLAPFSFFTCVSIEPPLLAIAMARRADGEKKDSLRNIESAGEFVVNIADDGMAREVSVSAQEFPYGRSEFDEVGLTPVPSDLVAAPRVAEAAISMECRRYDIVELGKGPHSLVIGEVVAWHFRDDVADDDGRTDFDALRPLGRLAGKAYAAFGTVLLEEAWELRR